MYIICQQPLFPTDLKRVQIKNYLQPEIGISQNKKISILHHRGFCKKKFTLQMLEMKEGTTNMPVHQRVPQRLSPEDKNRLVNVIKITEPFELLCQNCSMWQI